MRRVGGHQRHPPVGGLIRLDRRLAVGDAGNDDVALLGGGLLDDDHEVAVEDAGVDHRVAADPEHEQIAVAGEVDRHREQLFDVLLRQHVGAGGDVADERDVADGPALDHGAGVGIPADLDRPWLGRVAAEVAEPAERVEVAVHRRRRRQPDRLADLADRRGIAAIAGLDLDELRGSRVDVG